MGSAKRRRFPIIAPLKRMKAIFSAIKPGRKSRAEQKADIRDRQMTAEHQNMQYNVLHNEHLQEQLRKLQQDQQEPEHQAPEEQLQQLILQQQRLLQQQGREKQQKIQQQENEQQLEQQQIDEQQQQIEQQPEQQLEQQLEQQQQQIEQQQEQQQQIQQQIQPQYDAEGPQQPQPPQGAGDETMDAFQQQ
ncbi:uncharacterized protein EMH_0096870 [Eimeria mitis]|uniref:Uncharacterized protein n=1 Tax=Eimeria mitis TaxID=44415 RepID=U6KFW4_9EIME|nr:uncharacterized protein EMH_0096870 [Eimeria mitis]CDJ36824.1 hypothetical protein EMH_0096870 [Eimeria mitis]